ncbi:RNA pseudouridylate synthase domain-containing protein 2 [Batrachochytrium salamandrivorans]|nr:RNA pseudouridylate synthase domain-containing protein 2 [Batrachochytrium salamandrivorans]
MQESKSDASSTLLEPAAISPSAPQEDIAFTQPISSSTCEKLLTGQLEQNCINRKRPSASLMDDTVQETTHRDKVTPATRGRRIKGTGPRPTAPNKNPPPMSKKVRNQPNSAPPEYLLENGLRKVKPYLYVYQTYAKQRWLGLTIFQVFEKEFHDRPTEFYKQAIEKGKIRVNGAAVPLTYVIKNSDLVENTVHRHEPSVTDCPIDIVHQSDSILVVNKPGSIPVHPTGRYRHNTVIHLLEFEYKMQNLFLINRIDRLTSGLLLIARDKDVAASMMREMRERQVKKTYLARVKGEFPAEEVECNEPIETVQFKVGVNIVSPTGKPCSTHFKRLSYNGLTSVVQCEPKTGRTHQIRVHLQFSRTSYCQRSNLWVFFVGEDALLIPDASLKVAGDIVDDIDVDPLSNCGECRFVRSDPIPEQLVIWLHSWKYEGDSGWKFEAPRPDWADDAYEGDRQLVDRFWAYGGLWDGKAPAHFIE